MLDAHPLVRRGFEHVLGGRRRPRRASRAGFLRGRPDRRPPQSLEDAREEVELFHAYADAGLWNEADSTFVALDNPKHRFLAPAFERDLLLRFFPDGDWRQPPLWPGFGRYRSLAICFEMLGQFDDAIAAYRPADAALRGDALIAPGPIAAVRRSAAGRPSLANALASLSRSCPVPAWPGDEALRIARTIVPTDVYEWVHVFECLLRLGRLDAIDLGSVLYRPPLADEHRWSQLARQRMRLDYLRLRGPAIRRSRQAIPRPARRLRPRRPAVRARAEPLEPRPTAAKRGGPEPARAIAASAVDLCRRFGMTLLERDALARWRTAIPVGREANRITHRRERRERGGGSNL